jgi:hypothetical protein
MEELGGIEEEDDGSGIEEEDCGKTIAIQIRQG